MLKKITSTVFGALLATAIVFPASAMPLAVRTAVPATIESEAPLVQKVGHRYHRRHHRYHHRRGFYRHGGYGWYHGHRGYRHYRHGYRRYNGFWFPPAAFATGVIIGNAIGQPAVRVRPGYTNPDHVAWCYDRYRSYRAYDNTFQPYHGPRRPCRSPYY